MLASPAAHLFATRRQQAADTAKHRDLGEHVNWRVRHELEVGGPRRQRACGSIMRPEECAGRVRLSHGPLVDLGSKRWQLMDRHATTLEHPTEGLPHGERRRRRLSKDDSCLPDRVPKLPELPACERGRKTRTLRTSSSTSKDDTKLADELGVTLPFIRLLSNTAPPALWRAAAPSHPPAGAALPGTSTAPTSLHPIQPSRPAPEARSPSACRSQRQLSGVTSSSTGAALSQHVAPSQPATRPPVPAPGLRPEEHDLSSAVTPAAEVEELEEAEEECGDDDDDDDDDLPERVRRRWECLVCSALQISRHAGKMGWDSMRRAVAFHALPSAAALRDLQSFGRAMSRVRVSRENLYDDTPVDVSNLRLVVSGGVRAAGVQSPELQEAGLRYNLLTNAFPALAAKRGAADGEHERGGTR